MKQSRRKVPVFTVADHLTVQMEIEQRAHELWLTGGSCQDTALHNWLRAETEVLEEFIQAHENGHRDKRHHKQYGRSLPRNRGSDEPRRKD